MDVWSNPKAYIGKVIRANQAFDSSITKGRLYIVIDACAEKQTFCVMDNRKEALWMFWSKFDPAEPSLITHTNAYRPSLFTSLSDTDIDPVYHRNSTDTLLDNLVEAIFRQIENDQAIHRSSLKAVLELHLKNAISAEREADGYGVAKMIAARS